MTPEMDEERLKFIRKPTTKESGTGLMLTAFTVVGLVLFFLILRHCIE